MKKTVRFAVSLDHHLLDDLDRVLVQKKYETRSEAIRDLIRDHLIQSRGHVCPRAARVRARSAEPCRRSERMNRARSGGVFQIPERAHVFLVRLEWGENRAEFEIRAGAAGGPFVHRGAVRGVAHDRAVG